MGNSGYFMLDLSFITASEWQSIAQGNSLAIGKDRAQNFINGIVSGKLILGFTFNPETELVDAYVVSNIDYDGETANADVIVGRDKITIAIYTDENDGYISLEGDTGNS